MESNWKHRYLVLAIMFSAYLLCYMDRMVMASAIPFIAQDFHLSPLAMGGVLSAFFFSYALFQIPGGLLADKFGSRPILTAGIAWWSIFTALTGAASSLTTMLGIRVLFGMGEGIFPPAAFKTIASWFPKREVGRANGFMMATNGLGPALAPLFVVSLVAAWGWRCIFYWLFVPGIVIGALVWAYARSSPAQSKHMSAEELADYKEDNVQLTTSPKMATMDVLRMPLVKWCSLTLFFFNIGFWGIANWLPTYLLRSRGFKVSQMGIGASLPFFAGAIGFYVSGYLSDKYFRNSRQRPIIIGCIGGALFAYLTTSAHSGIAAVTWQIIGFFFITIATAAIYTLPIAGVPSGAVGAAAGVVNTVGQIAAFLSPLLVGYILSVTGGNFTIAFYVYILCFVTAAVLASRIKWGQPTLEKALSATTK